MKIDLTLDRPCRICREGELDHPCRAHFLYYLDYRGNETVYDIYETKEKVDEMMELLEELHGVSAVHNEYKFRHSYDECQGRF